VGDQDEGDAHLVLEPLELQLHLAAHLAVERRERLVEQQQSRPFHDRPSQGDPLALTARELLRAAPGHPGEADGREHLRDPAAHLAATQALALQAVGDVALDRHVREQRVRLEHQVHRTLVRRQPEQVLVTEQDRPGVGVLEAGDRSEQRGLSAPRRAEQREELVLGDGQAHVVEGDDVAEAPAHPRHLEQCPARRRDIRGGGGDGHRSSVGRIVRAAKTTTRTLTTTRTAASALISGVMPARTIE
jgi:hypothetical protein